MLGLLSFVIVRPQLPACNIALNTIDAITDGDRAASSFITSTPGERQARELIEAYEFATLVREAGRNAGARFRGERVEPPRRHTIAPWAKPRPL